MCIFPSAPIDQQKTVQQPSGGHANSNGMTIVPINEPTTDVANFHAKQRLSQSTPGSPQDHARPTSIEVVGSAESLVGRVIYQISCSHFSAFRSMETLTIAIL